MCEWQDVCKGERLLFPVSMNAREGWVVELKDERIKYIV